MNDTHPEIQKILSERYAKLTGAERLEMGCTMFDFCREIIEASVRAKQPGISMTELRQQTFLRLYENDFSEENRKKILQHLSQYATQK